VKTVHTSGTISASVPRHVPHDLCEISCILDDVYVSQHLEMGEIGCNLGNLQSECMRGGNGSEER
jgi:hypothetical protein